MTLWQAPIHITSEQAATCTASIPLDLLLWYVEFLKQQRGEQEKRIKNQESSEALVQCLKQLRELDNLINLFENRIRSEQDNLSTQGKEKRIPMEMVRTQYKGMKLCDIAAKVLRENSGLLTANELTRLIYETATADEFDRARNSLSSELRSGSKVQNPRWKKVGRNAYIAVEQLAEVIR